MKTFQLCHFVLCCDSAERVLVNYRVSDVTRVCNKLFSVNLIPTISENVVSFSYKLSNVVNLRVRRMQTVYAITQSSITQTKV